MGFDKLSGNESLVVVKEAYAYVMESHDGLDAKLRLRREAQNLKNLQETGITPKFVEYWEEEDSSFLVYELVEGPTLASLISSLRSVGLKPSNTVLYEWAIGLCQTIKKIHDLGYVLGDIKPGNLIFVDKRFHLIDLESAERLIEKSSISLGTHGYLSPERKKINRMRHYSDDVYSIGATLLAMATLTDASMLPDLKSVVQIEQEASPQYCQFYNIVAGCLEEDLKKRYSDTKQVLKELSNPALKNVSRTKPLRSGLDRDDFLNYARMIGENLLRDFQEDHNGRYWISNHPVVEGAAAVDLYAGSAGTALFLCELYNVTAYAPYLETAISCGNWLLSEKSYVPTEADMPGLYYGRSGIGWLYIKLYISTQDPIWRKRSIDISKEVSELSQHSYDLMTGTSGTGLFHLALWHLTKEHLFLDRAIKIAYELIDSSAPESYLWEIPEGHEGLTGKKYLGFAHGAAGIGYFLSECYSVKKDSLIRERFLKIADSLISLAQPYLVNNEGCAWPTQTGEKAQASNWCHGAPGIARFLLKAYQASGKSEYLEVSKKIGISILAGPSWNGTTQCHGLAGNSEILVDLGVLSNDDFYLQAALHLGERLSIYQDNGVWPSESHEMICPDFMVGQAGIGAAFIRLANPKKSHLISIDGLLQDCDF